jgi:hypothetical protein
MADQKERQRFSFKGFIVILILGAITYILVERRDLLTLYTLATAILVGLLVAVAFDIGVKKADAAPALEGPEEIETPTMAPTPKVKRRKGRR